MVNSQTVHCDKCKLTMTIADENHIPGGVIFYDESNMPCIWYKKTKRYFITDEYEIFCDINSNFKNCKFDIPENKKVCETAMNWFLFYQMKTELKPMLDMAIDLKLINGYGINLNKITLGVDITPKYYIKSDIYANDEFSIKDLKLIPDCVKIQSVNKIEIEVDIDSRMNYLIIDAVHPNVSKDGKYCLGIKRFEKFNLDNLMSIMDCIKIYNLNNCYYIPKELE